MSFRALGRNARPAWPLATGAGDTVVLDVAVGVVALALRSTTRTVVLLNKISARAGSLTFEI